MSRIFRGRPIIEGEIRGNAVVSRCGFNSLASYYLSLISGSEIAICTDKENKDLFGKILTNKIICLPRTIGSTSAGATWDRVAFRGIGPKAMLFSQTIDPLGAASMIIAYIWVNYKIITIDQLGRNFLDSVFDGNSIVIKKDGTVIVEG